MENSKECFFPLHGLIVDSQGSYGHCLTSKCRTSSLEELDEIRSSHHQMLKQGQWPKECASCEKKEQQGIQSRREKFISSQERSSNELGQEHIEINFSNMCNLTCAMCSGKYSSSWISLEEETPEFKDIGKLKISEKNKSYRLSHDQLNKIIELSRKAKTIIIKGGEPTLDPHLKTFLKSIDQLSDGGNYPNIFIQSNGSQDPNKWLAGIEHLKIELGISIDGVGETYQWIRGQQLELVKENIKLAQAHPAIKNISLDFTLSAFSVLELPEFLKMALTLRENFSKIEFCTFFQWSQDPYNTIGLLSPQLRKNIFDQTQNIFLDNSHFFLNFKSILNLLLLDSVDVPNMKEALHWIKLMDTKRGFSLFEVQPMLKIDMERI